MGITNEEAITTLKDLKDYYNDKNEDSYVGFDDEDNEALDKAIKALEQTDKIKRLFKTKMRTMTRDEFNEDFEESTISDIKDEMWVLHKIEEVLEDKAESEEAE
jgi:hypothetical protein